MAPFAVVATGVPLRQARRARSWLRNRSILSKVTHDGVTTLTVWVPGTMGGEAAVALVKEALGGVDRWDYKHATFEVLS